jgi:hypothetical protein
MPLTLISPAFADGETLPEKYARGGANLSPPLRWTGVPEKAKSLALVVEDPDAPDATFRHWAVYDMPPDRTELAESVETGPDRRHVRAAMNDFGNARWDGPDPPAGDGPHTYRFRLFALDVPELGLAPNARARDVVSAAGKRAVEEAELRGLYGR